MSGIQLQQQKSDYYTYISTRAVMAVVIYVCEHKGCDGLSLLLDLQSPRRHTS